MGVRHATQRRSPELFVKWKANLERSTGRKINVLRSDNGGEYKSDPFLQLCLDEGIERHFLNSLPEEEYETFTLTFINGRQTLDYHEVLSALTSYETRRKERHPSQSSSSAEALEVRGRGSSRKGKEVRGRSKSRSGYRDLRKCWN